MTLDSRLEAAARDVKTRIDDLAPPPVRERRRLGGTGHWLAVAAVALLLVVVLPRIGSVPFDVATGEKLISVEPPVVSGAPGPEPLLDTSELGSPFQLHEVGDVASALDRLAGGTVFIPDKYIIVGKSPAGTIAIIAEGQVRCIWVGTPSGTGSCRDILLPTDPRMHSRGYDGSLIWGPVPDGTSVVVLEYGDQRLWQRPTAEYVLFDTSLVDAEELTLTALDQQGGVILIDEQEFNR